MSIIREDWETILDKGPNQALENASRVIIPTSSMADQHTALSLTCPQWTRSVQNLLAANPNTWEWPEAQNSPDTSACSLALTSSILLMGFTLGGDCCGLLVFPVCCALRARGINSGASGFNTYVFFSSKASSWALICSKVIPCRLLFSWHRAINRSQNFLQKRFRSVCN